MLYHLGKLVLIIALVLLIPTTLILASQNSVPGDGMYPVKRKLEDGIIMIASLHPRTRAMFYTDFSKRRFTEAMAVIKKGGNGYQSLDELMSQTRTAATSVKNLSDKNDKKQLATDLAKQIEEYDRIISQLDKKQVVTPVLPTKTPVPSIKLSPVPTKAGEINIPTPTPAPVVEQPGGTNDYQKYLEELERLKKEVDALKNAQTSSQTTTTPTSTPIPTLIPKATPTTVPPSPTRAQNFSGGANPGEDKTQGPNLSGISSGSGDLESSPSAVASSAGDLLRLKQSVKGISTTVSNTGSNLLQIIRNFLNLTF